MWPGKYRMYLLSVSERYLMVSEKYPKIYFIFQNGPLTVFALLCMASSVYHPVCWSCRSLYLCLHACSGWGLLHTFCWRGCFCTWEKHKDNIITQCSHINDLIYHIQYTVYSGCHLLSISHVIQQYAVIVAACYHIFTIWAVVHAVDLLFVFPMSPGHSETS